ncbi:hypothetical protein SCP_1602800 [Sparassis crispa]|uniref:DNA breaking-rejoining enzyme n=1 Tax=Sparassis crispa TaxID=139825 RepID=A0A401H599_9APHY|nr:hypothetical protein SCP_1602800 [Sparassis crispa]GBE89617.1 hypothetical protein SCP_1602800 [Sparassis crispa]
MHHPEEYTPHKVSSYPPLSSQQISTGFSWTAPSHTPPQNFVCVEKDVTPGPSQSGLMVLLQTLMPSNNEKWTGSTMSYLKVEPSGMTEIPDSHFAATLPASTTVNPRPRPYKEGRVPLTSAQRPHCLAWDRLWLWLPLNRRTTRDRNGFEVPVTDDDLDRVLAVITVSWAQSTRESYGAGLLIFHIFCDNRGITEDQRCPASSILMLTFLSCCAGSYSGKTLANYFYTIRAWHTLHGQHWKMPQAEMKAALDGAAVLAPPSSKREKRIPFTVEFIILIRSVLDLSLPLDAAVYACLTTTFFCAARVGEFTLPNLKAFDKTIHVKHSDMREGEDRHGYRVTVFRLPRTKTSFEGKDVYWAEQQGLADPKAAMVNHLTINRAAQDASLFTWRHPQGARPLTRSEFLKLLDAAAAVLGITDSLKGHGIHIGAVLEYLLQGIPFEVVKSIGRWSSEAFRVYLRQHAVVMALYMQSSPILEPFTHYTMPPPR